MLYNPCIVHPREPLNLREGRQHCTIYQDCKYKQPHKICYCLTGLGKNGKRISIACNLNYTLTIATSISLYFYLVLNSRGYKYKCYLFHILCHSHYIRFFLHKSVSSYLCHMYKEPNLSHDISESYTHNEIK